MAERRAQTVFRVPRTAYLVVLFVLAGVVPLAFSGGAGPGGYTSAARLGLAGIALLVPVLVTLYVARTSTIVDAEGITVRALMGSRRMPWREVRGLSVSGRGVYAVLGGGSVRLPCVGVSNLAAMSRAADGHLPALAEPTVKHAPQRRRR